MSYLDEVILDEYEQKKELYNKLDEKVYHKLKIELESTNTMIMSLEHRVKEKNSLSGKLTKKEGKYHKLIDITDILGLRVICYYADDVDRISEMIEELFEIDWENSVDKRRNLNPSTFGYLSVHYVCSLKKEQEIPEELLDLKFEIQIRSTLQHIWAEIEHDLGYKSEFAIPSDVRRNFSRLASLLEVADEGFMDIRNNLSDYGVFVKKKLKKDDIDGINIDLISLKEFIKENKVLKEYFKKLHKNTNVEINYISPESYLEQLRWLKKTTLKDFRDMITDNESKALMLADRYLSGLELDIISSNAAIRFICIAELINKKYTEDEMIEFFSISAMNMERAKKQAQRVLEFM